LQSRNGNVVWAPHPVIHGLAIALSIFPSVRVKRKRNSSRSQISQWSISPFWQNGLFILVIATATILAYRPAWNGGFIWDDDAYITNNELLSAPDGLRRIWFSFDSPSQYFPLVYTTFRLEHALWGLNPAGYHWVNLLLHVANALLVWWVLLRLRVPGAWLASAIFALHPVHVESVAWITERKNVLMGLFFLSALLAWIAFIDQATRRRWFFYILSLILYALALSAKTTACTLPVALLLTLWLLKKSIDRRRILQLVPFVLLGLAAGLLTIWWERYHQGTHGALFALMPIERVLIASHAVWFYAAKLIWPVNLTFIYPRWTIDSTQPLDFVWLVAAAIAAAAIYLGRRYLGRSLEIAVLFFVATLSPVLGFIMLYTFRYTFVADHYQYLASIGPIAVISAGVMALAKKVESARQVIFMAAICLLTALGMLTWRQSHMYADIERLWRTTIVRNPGCWMAHNNLGVVLAQKGRIDEAIAHYQTTLQMQPDYSDADYNLGNALLEKGQIDEALRHCERAVAIQPNDPEAQVALANALLSEGRIEDAIVHYEKALAMRPYYFPAHCNLSRASLQKGDVDAATSHARLALLIQPGSSDAHINLAAALTDKGLIPEAVASYEKALQILPQSVSAQNNLAWLLATSVNPALRNGAKALELAKQANQLSHGENAVVLRTLAAACAELGQFSSALQFAQEAFRIATNQGANHLAQQLAKEIALYKTGSPYREQPQ
jgi:tetratricopeptide (TPR) repeat protein